MLTITVFFIFHSGAQIPELNIINSFYSEQNSLMLQEFLRLKITLANGM